MPRYVQPAPELTDPYESDVVLHAHLRRLLGDSGARDAAPRLAALGADVVSRLRAAHHDAETHPPVLRRYDAWGARVDAVEVAAGWETQRRAAAEHAVVALPYSEAGRAAFGAGARVVQSALLHLYGPESATFSCPVAMADGAAALLSRPDVDAATRDAWLPRLVSTDPDTAVTSGQWMTESQGGSDVSRSTTTARPDGDGWRLTGEKWFCSAADSAMSIALARPEGAGAGSRALAPFLVPRYAADGVTPAAGLRLHRLKDKLGTRAVPTAEIGLDGAVALPVGDPHHGGLARMMTLVVVTRLHNAAAAAGGMRRGLDHAHAYASRREIATGRLGDNPLHRATLARLEVDAQAAYALAVHGFALLGRVEVDGDDTAAAELRLVAPLAKIATARLAVASASEYLEAFGGAGYVEDTGLPRLLRDAQVLPIWEGTSNVLSVDVLRALAADASVKALLARVDTTLETDAAWADGSTRDALAAHRDALAARLAAAVADPGAALPGARDLARAASDTLTAALLAEHAAAASTHGHGGAVDAARLWIRSRLVRADIDADAYAAHEALRG